MSEQTGSPRLWRHLPDCFGCGNENDAALGISFEQQNGSVHATVVFDDRHVGGPGMAHGGAIMTLLDEVMGSVAGTGERRRVTASMQVEFRKPIALGRKLMAVGRITERLDRGYLVYGMVTYAEEPDVVRAEATARFVPLPEPTDGSAKPTQL